MLPLFHFRSTVPLPPWPVDSTQDHLKFNLLSIKTDVSYWFVFLSYNRLTNTLDSQEGSWNTTALLNNVSNVWLISPALRTQCDERGTYIAIWQSIKYLKSHAPNPYANNKWKKQDANCTMCLIKATHTHTLRIMLCEEKILEQRLKNIDSIFFFLQVAEPWVMFIKMPVLILVPLLVSTCSFSSGNKRLFKTNQWNFHTSLQIEYFLSPLTLCVSSPHVPGTSTSTLLWKQVLIETRKTQDIEKRVWGNGRSSVDGLGWDKRQTHVSPSTTYTSLPISEI